MLQQGSEAAFTRIYHQYYPELYLLARRLVGDKGADVVADVFLQFWQTRPKLEKPEHLPAYLRAMTRNAALRVIQQDNRQQTMLSELALTTDQEYEEQYFREILEGRLFSLIRHEIDQLAPHLREVFKLSYMHGLSNAEIAEQLGMSNASVRVRKSEALQQLRAALYHVELVVVLQLLLPGAA